MDAPTLQATKRALSSDHHHQQLQMFEGVSTVRTLSPATLQGELKTMSRGDLHENAAGHGFITLTIRWGLPVCSCFAHAWAPFLRQRCGETRSDRSHIRTRMAWDRQIDVRGALQRGHAGSAAVTQRAGESCWPVRAAHGLRTRQRQALPPARGFPTSRKLLLPPARGSAPARVSTQTVLRVALIKPRTETAEPQ